ncbi:MAG: LysR family transcriptional regulator [Hyphomonas sp.]
MRLESITLKQLRALAAVVRTGSLTDAGAEIGLTTPAIHSQIKTMEKAVGRTLVERRRDGTGFASTPTGQILLDAAARINGNLSQAAARVASLQRGYLGHVRLSVVSTAKYFAPSLVRMLRDGLPEIEVEMRVGNRERVISELAEGGADLAIMGRPPRVPMVDALPLGPHPHGVILPPGHPLRKEDGFDSSALIDETFLAREEGSGTRALMLRFFDRLGEGAMPKLITLDSNETIKQAVLVELGIAFLSLHTVSEELASGRLVALRGPGLPVMRQWYLVRPADVPAAGAVKRVSDTIVSLAGCYFPDLPRPAS